MTRRRPLAAPERAHACAPITDAMRAIFPMRADARWCVSWQKLDRRRDRWDTVRRFYPDEQARAWCAFHRVAFPGAVVPTAAVPPAAVPAPATVPPEDLVDVKARAAGEESA